jgi:hypothetical protein
MWLCSTHTEHAIARKKGQLSTSRQPGDRHQWSGAIVWRNPTAATAAQQFGRNYSAFP